MDKVKTSLKTLKEFKNQFQVDFKGNNAIQMKMYTSGIQSQVSNILQRR